MPHNSPNPVALVTGGSRGLGRSTVLALAQQGVDSIFTYYANEAEALNVARCVASVGRSAVALQLDAGSASDFDLFAEKVREALQTLGTDQLDYLVNNAGISHHAGITQITENDLDQIFNVHFKGVLLLTQKLLPLMRDGGRIVNVSSGLTRIISPGSAVYASIKGAVEILTRYMAKELSSRRIAVNVVAPGAIETDFGGGMVRDNPEINKRVRDVTALGRAGVPDDIGPMIASLLSECNRWINGERIEVSGGMAL